MGAWGSGIFDNDGALDYVGDVVSESGLSQIEATLDHILSVKQEYLEAPDSENALVAAEILARLQGHGNGEESTDELEQWIEKTKILPTRDLLEKARKSVIRILTEPSELLELWNDAGKDGNEWKACVENLASRLQLQH
ncbi:MAG: DUF4259 domain-containing protein [Terracidiphilus sp.]